MSVEFEPVRIGRHRRRLDAVSIGAIVVAIGLAAVVLKPWQVAADHAGAGTASLAPPAASAAPAAKPTASVALPRILRSAARPSPTWAEVEPVLRRHEAWGIRAVVATRSATRPFEERWFPIAGDGTGAETAHIDATDRSILALGVTFPPAHTPLDVRAWRIGSGGLEWMDTEALDTVPSAGAFLFVQPGNAGAPVRAWSAGSYRIDVLVDGSVRRVGVTIPSRFSNVPAPGPGLSTPDDLVDPKAAPLPDLPIGLFATVDGVSVPLPAEEGPPLDETAAWLDVDPGTRRGPRSFVASANLPRATGLGVMLPPGSVVQSAAIVRLAPEPLPGMPPRVDPGAATGTASDHVVFRASNGATWTPGTYRLSVIWADADGLHDRSWHAELRPGPVRPLPRLLAAARSWARYAGATGVLLGSAKPVDGGPEAATIRLLRLRPEAGPAYPADSGVGCRTTRVDGLPGILGFAYPDDHYASTASARVLFPFVRGEEQVVMTAAFGVRGLILVAPARRPTLATAGYQFTIGEADDAVSYTVCLGMTESND